MLFLALGYVATYIPYAILAKTLSRGVLPGTSHPVGGFVRLAAAANGQRLAQPGCLAASGRWRFASEAQPAMLVIEHALRRRFAGQFPCPLATVA